MERTLQNEVEVTGGSWVGLVRYGDAAGPAAVILPGVMSDAAAWEGVARALRAWPAVVVVNRRGRHPSGPLGPDYSLDVEVEDLRAVLRRVGDVPAVIGWSYGGLIALRAADRVPVPHVIAYEPVMRPFAAHALPALAAADAAGDRDATVRTVVTEVSGMGQEAVESLRANPRAWEKLRALAEPVHAETVALNAGLPERVGGLAQRVDLVVGELNRGRAPYGTSFDDVARRVPAAQVHVLAGQGHMGHLEDPAALAALVDRLGDDA